MTKAPKPPYYAVIFTSQRSSKDLAYDEMDRQTFIEVNKIKGYIGAQSYTDGNDRHVTIAYFLTEKAILDWRSNPLHEKAQQLGKEKWYSYYNVKVCKVEREYEFTND